MTESAFTFPPLLGFGLPGGYEWIILLVLALLIFGRRLPEVGRSLGKGIVEFKRGIKGIEDEIENESSQPERRPQVPADPPQELPRPTAPAEPTVAQDAGPSENSDEPARTEPSGHRADRSSG